MCILDFYLVQKVLLCITKYRMNQKTNIILLIRDEIGSRFGFFYMSSGMFSSLKDILVVAHHILQFLPLDGGRALHMFSMNCTTEPASTVGGK